MLDPPPYQAERATYVRGPGKSAPRLVADLEKHALGSDILTAVQHNTGDTVHRWLLDIDADTTFDDAEETELDACCELTRNHLHLQLEHVELADGTLDRGCRNRNKLHHFQLVHDASVRAPFYESFDWNCSRCSTGLKIRLWQPEIPPETLTQVYAIRPQASYATAKTRTQADGPSRFSTFQSLEYYVRHTAKFVPTETLQSPRRIGLASISGEPSMFAKRVGREPAITLLMKDLCFKLAPADWDGESPFDENDVTDEFDGAETDADRIEWEWIPPNPLQVGMRSKLRRIRLELQILAQAAKVPSDPFNTKPWLVSFERAESHMLAVCDAPLRLFTAAPKWQPSESSDERAHSTLGIVPIFTDNAVLEFFQLQSDQDPARRSHYLSALNEIAKLRRGDDMQLELQRQRSMGNYTREDLSEAYRLLNECRDEDDETVINIAESLMLDNETDSAKSRIRHAVELIGSERQSGMIASYLDTPKRDFDDIDAALAYLGAESTTDDDFLMILYDDKAESNERLARAALGFVADERKNHRLRRFLDTGDRDETPAVPIAVSPKAGDNPTKAELEMLDPDLAYSRLGVDDRTIADDMLIMLYEIRAMDEPEEMEKLRRALEVVGDARASEQIRNYLLTGDKGAPAPYAPPPGRSDMPVGLENIGNTCYLNSLLQYYFSVRPLRDLIMDSSQWKDTSLADRQKKVGGRLVTTDEIDRAKSFMRELRQLFAELMTCAQGSYKPSRAVCFLALVSHRQALAKDTTSVAVLDKNVGADLQTAETNQLVLFGQDSQDNKENVDMDVEMTSPELARSPKRKSSMTDTITATSNLMMPAPALEENLVDIDLMETDTTEPQTSTDSGDSPLASAGAKQVDDEPPRKMRKDGIWEDKTSDPSCLHDEVEVFENEAVLVDIPGNVLPRPAAPPAPPAVPSRPAVRRKSSLLWSEVNDWGQQQDVAECIDNCLFQMEAALESELEDERNGEQLDLVKTLFYGKTLQKIEIEGNEPRQDWFSNTIVSLSRDGQDLYGALDGVFDPVGSKVELEGKQVMMTTRMSLPLPQILQIQIQRATFDLASMSAKKDNTYLRLDEVVYMDRYLDDDSLVEERDEYAGLNRTLAALEERQAQLRNQIDSLEVAGPLPSPPMVAAVVPDKQPLYRDHSWTATAQEVDSDSDQEPDDGMRRGSVREILTPRIPQEETTESTLQGERTVEVDETAEEAPSKEELQESLEDITSEISRIKERLRQCFADRQEHGYTLHSVFMHRGEASHGHYWIYIRDFQQCLWRKYNDEEVTIIDRDVVFADLQGKNENPYMLTYVRIGQEEALTSALCRQMQGATEGRMAHENENEKEVQQKSIEESTVPDLADRQPGTDAGTGADAGEPMDLLA
ncbi:ubiquitin-specific protease ubp2 [Savitreella phatthalungensis]